MLLTNEGEQGINLFLLRFNLFLLELVLLTQDFILPDQCFSVSRDGLPNVGTIRAVDI